LAVIVALSLEAWLTGALHEDGVADFCDAFGGGWTRERTLAILADSRIGTFGALGLGLAVALRAGAIVALVDHVGIEQWPAWGAALAASSTIGRWVIVLVMAWVSSVPDRESLTNAIGRELGIGGLILATLFTLPAAILFAVQMPLHAGLAAAMLFPFIYCFVRLIRKRLGGVTGDCFGFIAYITQTLVLLAAAARLPS
jgi:adenosylcobinamide-GDP ribazoletransferase